MQNIISPYSVGALLYSPANSQHIAESLIAEKWEQPFSLALCLEDTINDAFIEEAEATLIHTLKTLYKAKQSNTFYMPKLFIRVRCPEQITKLLHCLEQAKSLICGFIIPKFSLETAQSYIDTLTSANALYDTHFYMMPILESPSMIPLNTRYDMLYALREKLKPISQLILNIRVGGNDLCHQFGFRCPIDASIYQIAPIASLLSDIITVFGMDYVVSGPVWEYYNGKGWDTGLNQTLHLDKLYGFIGKTVIHPSQIPFVNNAYKVSKKDYDDACAILNWDNSSQKLVAGSATHERMNEYKTHYNWAYKILEQAKAYGVTD